jgi:hypothetical protein
MKTILSCTSNPIYTWYSVQVVIKQPLILAVPLNLDRLTYSNITRCKRLISFGRRRTSMLILFIGPQRLVLIVRGYARVYSTIVTVLLGFGIFGLRSLSCAYVYTYGRYWNIMWYFGLRGLELNNFPGPLLQRCTERNKRFLDFSNSVRLLWCVTFEYFVVSTSFVFSNGIQNSKPVPEGQRITPISVKIFVRVYTCEMFTHILDSECLVTRNRMRYYNLRALG